MPEICTVGRRGKTTRKRQQLVQEVPVGTLRNACEGHKSAPAIVDAFEATFEPCVGFVL
jgi:hypothetical protein